MRDEFVNDTHTRKYSRSEIAAFCDKEIESATRSFGADGYWTKKAIESKQAKLKEFDSGEVVEVFTESHYKNGFEYVVAYMSDGTTHTFVYSAD